MTQRARSTTPVTIGLPFTDKPLNQFSSAVRSVLAQTHQHWSLILVADGASEETLEYARSLNDSRVHLEVFDQQGGLARRLNQIAAMTETPFLFRMDADDIMHPERVARQLSVLESEEVDLVGSRAYLIDGADKIYGLMKEPATVPPPSTAYLTNAPVLMHPTLAASTEWFRRNLYDESLLRAEDKALFICAARSTRMAKISEPLLFYRVCRPFPQRHLHFKFDRVVLRKYGHLLASRPTVLGYVAKSLVKQQIFHAMSKLGAEDYLFERKIDHLDKDAIHRAEVILNSAVRCPRNDSTAVGD